MTSGDIQNLAIEVCGDTCSAIAYQGAVAEWFTTALRRQCTLARRPAGKCERSSGAGARAGAATRTTSDHMPSVGSYQGDTGLSGQDAEPAPLAFSNEGQFLIVSEQSVADLHARLPPNKGGGTVDDERAIVDASHSSEHADELQELTARLRPNVVVRGTGAAYTEDHWDWVRALPGSGVGGTEPEAGLLLRGFQLCNRCGVVNVHTRTAVRLREPFLTLANYRRVQGRVNIGKLFSIMGGSGSSGGASPPVRVLEVGQQLLASSSHPE